jgi:type II secretory pathway component PulK
MRQHRTASRGVTTVATIVATSVALSIAMAMLATTMKHRLQLSVERDARQADLLLAAGRDRALRDLKADPEYDGERRFVAVLDTPVRRRGAVRVTIDRKGAPDSAVVRVSVKYPLDDLHAIRRSLEFRVPQPLRKPAPSNP